MLISADSASPSIVAEHKFPPLNPPTIYPLFSAFALLPMHPSFVAWVAVSVGICAAIVPLSRRTLADRGVAGTAVLDHWELAPISAAFVTSNAPRTMILSGQLGVVPALGLIAALLAQSRERPVRASLWLVAGTTKPNTVLSFLLLFLRRRDLKPWAAALGLAILLVFGWVTDPGRHATVYLRTVGKYTGPGTVNALTFTGPLTPGMVGLDYALYRLGFRTVRSAGLAQIVVLLAIGAALAARIFPRRGALPAGGDCAQVALYSTIFLYHHTHDFIVLALPLTYAAARARVASGRARWALTFASAAILVALSQQRKAVELLEAAIKDRTDLLALILQALVLPYATWLVLAAMLALALGDRWEPESSVIPDIIPAPPEVS